MDVRLIAAASCLVLVASPALAQDAPSAPAPAPAKKICRSIVPTGSIMGKRICLTKTEWQEFNRLNQDDAENAMSKKPALSPRERPG